MQLDGQKAKALIKSKSATELAREAARQSIVLLKNDVGLFAIKKGQYKTIAVIGSNADVCRLIILAALLNHVHIGRYKTISGRCYTGKSRNWMQVAHNDTGDSYSNWRYVNEIDYVSLEENLWLIKQAVELSSKSDLVVLAIGESVLLSREAWGGNHIGDTGLQWT